MVKSADKPPVPAPTQEVHTSGFTITSRDPNKPMLPEDMEQVANVQTALTAEKQRPVAQVVRIIEEVKKR